MMTFASGLHGDGSKTITRQEVLDVLDKVPEILNWRADAGAVFLVSESDLVRLRELIQKAVPNLLFVVGLISPQTTDGWASQDTWDFINKPKKA